ncbi:MAG: Minf_1886 family protein [Kiritimatiellia bacterium]
MEIELHQKINEICKKDRRFSVNAYFFILDALRVSAREIRKKDADHSRHLSGQELSQGIKQYAIKCFGCMSYTVMELWGIKKTADFGAIVYNLIEVGLLGKSGDDSIDDFNDIFDFNSAFLKPFQPSDIKGRKTS